MKRKRRTRVEMKHQSLRCERGQREMGARRREDALHGGDVASDAGAGTVREDVCSSYCQRPKQHERMTQRTERLLELPRTLLRLEPPLRLELIGVGTPVLLETVDRVRRDGEDGLRIDQTSQSRRRWVEKSGTLTPAGKTSPQTSVCRGQEMLEEVWFGRKRKLDARPGS